MAIETNIEWCDSTINPTTGCEGCELWNGKDIRICYAGPLHENRLAKSYPNLYTEDFQEVRLAPGRMMQAAHWPDLTGKYRPNKPWFNRCPRHIFIGDMGDFCSQSVPEEYIIEEIIGAIRSREGQRSFWLMLTKQIRRLAEISEKIGGLPDNCMSMTSVTSQLFADQRIPWLLKVQCKWRGISAEPLLGPVSLPIQNPKSKIESCLNWVVVGGESGPHARPMHPDWVRSIRDQCQAASIPFFFKQWGEWAQSNAEVRNCSTDRVWLTPGGGALGVVMSRVGKKAAGALLDGREWREVPK